jgi:hypothetical protein
MEFEGLLAMPPGSRAAGLRQLPPEQRTKLVAQLAELMARTVDPEEAATVDGAGSKADPTAGEPRS